MQTLLGIDIGTSATRAALISIDGTQIGIATRSHRVDEPKPGYVEHDAERSWWGETCEALREISARFPEETRRVQAIGIGAIGASIVPVDENGLALRPAILYGVDRRSLSQIADIERKIGPDEIRRRTGRNLTTQSVGPKILWIRENEPEIAARTHRFLPPAAFLSQRLCGVAAIDFHTALAMDPLFLAENKTWDCQAISFICRKEQLPEVRSAGAPLGGLRANLAQSLGLQAGIPVCCGTADVLAEGLGAGAVNLGDTLVMYGSTLFIVHLTKEFSPRPPFWATFYPIKGVHCVATGTGTAGAAAQWFLQTAAGDNQEIREELLRDVACARAASDGLVFLPYLRGERAPIFNPSARGIFFGLTARHSAADMYRAVVEGIGFSLRHVLDEMRPDSQRLLMSGGGSDLHMPLQLAVDASNAAQLRARRGRNAGYGAAVLAGLGVGCIERHDLNDRFFGTFEEVKPSPANAAEFDAAYNLYRRVGESCTDLFNLPIYTNARS